MCLYFIGFYVLAEISTAVDKIKQIYKRSVILSIFITTIMLWSLSLFFY